MMLITPEIRIGESLFWEWLDCEIESTWRVLSDVAVVKFHFKTPIAWTIDQLKIKVGDKVEIKLGYNYNPQTRFTGYVSKIEIGNKTITVHCDDAYHLKKAPALNKAYQTVQLKQLIQDIVPSGQKFDVRTDFSLGKFYIREQTPAQVLEFLTERYGIYSFLRAGVLYVGFAYNALPLKRTELNYAEDTWAADSTTRFVSENTEPLRVRAISFSDGKKIEAVYGPSDAPVQTLHFADMEKGDLEKIAKERSTQWSAARIEGEIRTWGNIYAEHSEILDIYNPYTRTTSPVWIEAAKTVLSADAGLKRFFRLGRMYIK